MFRILSILAAIVIWSSCVVGGGRPAQFNDAPTWTIPLIGAMDNNAPLTQVYINGKGPYLFTVSLDGVSTLSRDLVRELGLRMITTGLKLRDNQDDTSFEKGGTAEVKTMTVGNLTITNQEIVFLESFDGMQYNGRPIMGSFGARTGMTTLMWSLDRDREVLRLAKQGELVPSPQATKIDLRPYGDAPTLYVDAHLDDNAKANMQIQFRGLTALRPELAREARLADNGRGGWRASVVRLDDLSVPGLELQSLQDARMGPEDHGVLGFALWQRFNIMTNVHEKSMWLETRQPISQRAQLTAERISRWAPLWTSCQKPACVTLEVASDTPDANTPGTTSGGGGVTPVPVSRPPQLVVTREPVARGAEPYEIVIEAVNADGHAMGLPYIHISMQPGQLEQRFAIPSMGAGFSQAKAFRLVDATPLPITCSDPNGCIWAER